MQSKTSPCKAKECTTSKGGGIATFLMIAAMMIGMAHAQSGPRIRLASPTPRAPSAASIRAVQPAVLIPSRAVYSPRSRGVSQGTFRNVPATTGPYVTGPGQWVPTGAQLEVFRFEAEPGYTVATPASASGHWDWKRATLADLVELSRRNKAARGED